MKPKQNKFNKIISRHIKGNLLKIKTKRKILKAARDIDNIMASCECQYRIPYPVKTVVFVFICFFFKNKGEIWFFKKKEMKAWNARKWVGKYKCILTVQNKNNNS